MDTCFTFKKFTESVVNYLKIYIFTSNSQKYALNFKTTASVAFNPLKS